MGSFVSAALGGVADIRAGRAQEAEARLGVRQLEFGGRESAIQRRKNLNDILGQQLTIQGASGFAVDSTSFQLVREASVTSAERAQSIDDLLLDFERRRLLLGGRRASQQGFISAAGRIVDAGTQAAAASAGAPGE